MAEEVVLLDFWSSPYGMRVRIALAEKGIEYEHKEEEDIFAGKSPLLLKMNPIHQKVPVLIHNGKPICESLVILQYIDQLWTHKSPFLPQDPFQRASARFWADFFDKKISAYGRGLWAGKGEEHEEAKKEFIECLKLLEGELGEKSYFGGDHLGFLDIALIPFSCRFYTYEKFANFTMEEKCPKLIKWVNRCLEIESVAKVLPKPLEVYEFVLEVKKRFGLE